MSHHTFKTHLNHIFAKTGSRDRVAAVAYAQAHGLAGTGEPGLGRNRLNVTLKEPAIRPSDPFVRS